MASIKKSNGNYYIVGSEIKDGKRVRPLLHPHGFKTQAEAELKRKEIEIKQGKNKFIAPSTKTVSEFFDEFADYKATSEWGPQTLSTNMYLIDTHIKPYFKNFTMGELNSVIVDGFITSLASTKCKQKDAFLSAKTRQNIYDIVKGAMTRAVEQKIIEENPLTIKRPTVKKKPKVISKTTDWSEDNIKTILSEKDKNLVELFIHIAYISSLRIGEAMGIEIKNIDFENKTLLIENTLERIKLSALEKTNYRGVNKIFPEKKKDSISRIVLKSTKTESSTRILNLNENIIADIKVRLREIEEEKATKQGKYTDYGLLFAHPDGSPIEVRCMLEKFKIWQEKYSNKAVVSLPTVSSHAIRGYSATYKLMETHDIKAVQADLGHTTADMTLNYYASINDESRHNLASKFSERCYPTPEPEEQNIDYDDIEDKVIELMAKNPEFKKSLFSKVLGL